MLKAYIFALFNENDKTGAGSENYYGLFKADGSMSYNIGFYGLKSSSAIPSYASLKVMYSILNYNSKLLLCLQFCLNGFILLHIYKKMVLFSVIFFCG